MIGADKGDRYVLQLYINGTTPSSIHAVSNIRRICEERLHGHYELEIIDVSQRPHIANDARILALPTLIKKLPPPERRFVGDMSQTEHILSSLNLHEA